MNEHEHQVAYFRWLGYKHPNLLAYAIPNGGLRNKAVAGKLKAEGVVSGIPDIFVAHPNGTHHGLYIEMKAEKGRPSKSQVEIKARLELAGYRVDVCHGWHEAMAATQEYLGDWG